MGKLIALCAVPTQTDQKPTQPAVKNRAKAGGHGVQWVKKKLPVLSLALARQWAGMHEGNAQYFIMKSCDFCSLVTYFLSYFPEITGMTMSTLWILNSHSLQSLADCMESSAGLETGLQGCWETDRVVFIQNFISIVITIIIIIFFPRWRSTAFP